MAGEDLSSQAPSREGRNTDSGHRDKPAGTPGGDTAGASDSDIRLTLPARPENVAVVRHVLGAFADGLGLPGLLSEKLRLAVTEACSNVVRHAYAGDDGALDVTMRPRGEMLELVVSDDGRGIGPSPDTAGPGLGLPLIAALTDSLEIERSATNGSRLVMSFERTRPAMGLA